MTRKSAAWLLLCCLPALAAEGVSDSDRQAPKSAVVRKAADATTPTATNSEVHKAVSIPAGKNVTFDSELDFTSADKAAVTVRCTTCDSADNSMGKVVLQAYWTVPDAELFAVSEAKYGSTFPYYDSGGVAFQVYGPQFRLTIQNKGANTLVIDQVTIFRLVR